MYFFDNQYLPDAAKNLAKKFGIKCGHIFLARHAVANRTMAPGAATRPDGSSG